MAVHQLLAHDYLEDAVPEELEPLVGVLPARCPGAVGEDLAPSAGPERREHSLRRLEFLGDSVLRWSRAKELMHRNPDVAEGDLSWTRQAVVGRGVLRGGRRRRGLPEALVAAAAAGRRDAARDSRGRVTVRAAHARRPSVPAGSTLAPTRSSAVLEAFSVRLSTPPCRERDPRVAPGTRRPRRRVGGATS